MSLQSFTEGQPVDLSLLPTFASECQEKRNAISAEAAWDWLTLQQRSVAVVLVHATPESGIDATGSEFQSLLNSLVYLSPVVVANTLLRLAYDGHLSVSGNTLTLSAEFRTFVQQALR